MKGNNGTNRIPKCCCPNHHRTSPEFHCCNQVFHMVGFLGCSPDINSSDVGYSVENNLSDHITHTCSSCVMSSFYGCNHHLCIWALLSVIRGLAVAALLWILELWSSRETVFVETVSSRWLFSFAGRCAAVVLWFFETSLLNEPQSLSVSVKFHPLFMFTDVVFPWFAYANITLETVTFDTPNNVAVFITYTS
jgi:hypothetical protein